MNTKPKNENTDKPFTRPVRAMDIQLMIDNLGQLPIREQRDILLTTLRNLVDYVDDSDNIIEGSKTIAELLNAAADGKL